MQVRTGMRVHGKVSTHRYMGVQGHWCGVEDVPGSLWVCTDTRVRV